MDYLIQNYGPGDPYQAKSKFDAFHIVGIDTTFYVSSLDAVINNALLASASITEDEIFEKLTNEKNINAEFYKAFITERNMGEN